jgi:RNA polymerase sigma factor (sigma-70 family)
MATGQINRVIEHIRRAVVAGDAALIKDGQLLECFVTRREEQAFELLLKRHGPMVLGVCKRVLGNYHDAEDAFQATFLVLARKASSIRPREMVGNWLYGVAHKTALRAQSVLAKRRIRERQMNPMPDREAPAPDLWTDVHRVLDEELSRLGDKYRVPIILCDLEGKSQKEAAQCMGLPEGTFSSRLSRGRTMLAKRLGRRRLTLSAAALAAMLSPKRALACVQPGLASSTLKAASAFGARQSVADLVSSSVVSLTQGILKVMLLTKLTKATAAFLVVAGLSLAVRAQVPSTTGQAERDIETVSQAVQPAGPAGKVKDRAHGFDDLNPAARFQVVRKLTDPDKEFQSADRGDVILSMSARGSLASANNCDIYCQVRSRNRGVFTATTVKSVVEDGALVHKGDILVTLDDSYWQEQHRERSKAYQMARAAISSAELSLERVQLQTELRELDYEIALRVAESKLKKFAGNDPDEKEILTLEVKKARVSRQLAKLEGKSRVGLARRDLESKIAAADLELAQLEDIKDQIKKCTIKAPKDGRVYYYIPERTRANEVAPILAVGEPVREGQKLMQIPDLDNMLASIRVPEALVTSLHEEDKTRRKWQAALIEVDAYPKTVLKGHVKLVDAVADRSVAGSEKVYRTLVTIDRDQNPELPRLLQGMSANVTINEVARKNAVVRVPVKAVVQVGKKHYCYVKVGKEIVKREVALGVRDHQFVEIKSGVQEADQVARDVDGLIRRLSPLLGPRKE